MEYLGDITDLINVEPPLPPLPPNTPDTDAGTRVIIPEEWYIQTPNYTRTSDGQIATRSTKVASVYAVSDGEGNIVPIPNGFYYVGGTIASGVVISDNEDDQLLQENNKGKYWGEADVPSGISITDGKLNNEFKGNQYVWIPCTNYNKYNWGQGNTNNRSSAYWDTTVDEAGKQQVKKYGGFYVGRYEAGLPQGTTEHPNNTLETSNYYDAISGTAQSKAGLVPWIFVSWTTARAKAQGMAEDLKYTSVNTGLITGAQWDVMIQKIASVDNTKSITNSGSWGNYYSGITGKDANGNAVTYFKFNGRYAVLASGKLSAFTATYQKEGTKNNNTYWLLTTGASEHNKGYNIYDVAGNVWEWTDETSWLYNATTTGQYRVMRGGSCKHDSSACPACYRHGEFSGSSTWRNAGFRISLYIK